MEDIFFELGIITHTGSGPVEETGFRNFWRSIVTILQEPHTKEFMRAELQQLQDAGHAGADPEVIPRTTIARPSQGVLVEEFCPGEPLMAQLLRPAPVVCAKFTEPQIREVLTKMAYVYQAGVNLGFSMSDLQPQDWMIDWVSPSEVGVRAIDWNLITPRESDSPQIDRMNLYKEASSLLSGVSFFLLRVAHVTPDENLKEKLFYWVHCLDGYAEGERTDYRTPVLLGGEIPARELTHDRISGIQIPDIQEIIDFLLNLPGGGSSAPGPGPVGDPPDDTDDPDDPDGGGDADEPEAAPEEPLSPLDVFHSRDPAEMRRVLDAANVRLDDLSIPIASLIPRMVEIVRGRIPDADFGAFRLDPARIKTLQGHELTDKADEIPLRGHMVSMVLNALTGQPLGQFLRPDEIETHVRECVSAEFEDDPDWWRDYLLKKCAIGVASCAITAESSPLLWFFEQETGLFPDVIEKTLPETDETGIMEVILEAVQTVCAEEARRMREEHEHLEELQREWNVYAFRGDATYEDALPKTYDERPPTFCDLQVGEPLMVDCVVSGETRTFTPTGFCGEGGLVNVFLGEDGETGTPVIIRATGPTSTVPSSTMALPVGCEADNPVHLKRFWAGLHDIYKEMFPTGEVPVHWTPEAYEELLRVIRRTRPTWVKGLDEGRREQINDLKFPVYSAATDRRHFEEDSPYLRVAKRLFPDGEAPPKPKEWSPELVGRMIEAFREIDFERIWTPELFGIVDSVANGLVMANAESSIKAQMREELGRIGANPGMIPETFAADPRVGVHVEELVKGKELTKGAYHPDFYVDFSREDIHSVFSQLAAVYEAAHNLGWVLSDQRPDDFMLHPHDKTLQVMDWNFITSPQQPHGEAFLLMQMEYLTDFVSGLLIRIAYATHDETLREDIFQRLIELDQLIQFKRENPLLITRVCKIHPHTLVGMMGGINPDFIDLEEGHRCPEIPEMCEFLRQPL